MAKTIEVAANAAAVSPAKSDPFDSNISIFEAKLKQSFSTNLPGLLEEMKYAFQEKFIIKNYQSLKRPTKRD